MSVSERRNVIARCFVPEAGARALYLELREMPDVIDILGGVYRGNAAGHIADFSTRTLPPDLSFWKFSRLDHMIYLARGCAFSDDALLHELRCLRRGRATLTCWCDYNDFMVTFNRTPVGFVLQGGFGGNFTLQETISHLRQLCQLPIWNSSVGLNWRYEGVFFRPCILDQGTNSPVEPRFQCSTEDAAIRCCTSLLTLSHAPPRLIGYQVKVPEKEIDAFAANYQHSESRDWTYCVRGTYADGFDPFCRPNGIPPQGLRFPIAEKSDLFDRRTQRTEIQMTCVHQMDCSYVEFLSACGVETLREWTGRFPNLTWEFWPGAESERWDGDPTPEVRPVIKSAPPVMYRAQLDYEIPCFVDQRVLTLFIDSGIVPTESHQWTTDSCRRERESAGYTPVEQAHLTKVDMIEAKFEEIRARYTGWDRIRFWWPHKNDPRYWDQRPKLRQVKTLPMKIRGEIQQIPVEFVEPLKCPM